LLFGLGNLGVLEGFTVYGLRFRNAILGIWV